MTQSSSPPDAVARPRTGSQAVERALALLAQIAVVGRHGCPLGALADMTGLDKATTRRLLLALQRHGFIDQDDRTRLYFPGMEFFTVAAAAANRMDLSETREIVLRRLSDETGRSAAFFQRDGGDLVCIDVVNRGGGLRIDIGARWPLAADAFSVAVLAALPLEQAETLALANLRRYSSAIETDIRELGVRIRRARAEGHTLESHETLGGWRLAVAVRDRAGRPEGAIGIFSGGEIAPADHGALALLVGRGARQVQEAIWRLPAGLRSRRKRTATPFEKRESSHCETDVWA